MNSNYPDWICFDCGQTYGRHASGEATTYHNGTCDICGSDTSVTQPRDFGHLRPTWQRELRESRKCKNGSCG